MKRPPWVGPWGWLGLLPVAVALLLYLPAVPGADWVLDDRPLLRDHVAPAWVLGEWLRPTFAAAGGEQSFVWRPLVASGWRLLGAVFGVEPWIFRLFNLLLLVTELLLVQRCVRLIGVRKGVSATPIAVILAVVLALHPSTPEVVGWSSSAFDLCAAVCLLKAVEGGLGGSAVGGWLLAALLCKETALPAVILVPLLIRSVTIQEGLLKRQLFEGLGAAGIWLLLHAGVTGQFGESGGGWESGIAWLQGVGMLVVPPRAAFAHLFNPGEAVSVGLGLAALALVCSLDARSRPVSWALGIWGGMMVPVALGVPLIGLWPLRYLHLPLILGLLPMGAFSTRRRWVMLVAVGLGLAWGPRVASRVDEWNSESALWQGELAEEPGNSYALRQWVHFRWPEADLAERRILLASWQQAISSLPRPLTFFDPVEERFELAKGAFQVGDPALARSQVLVFLTEHPDRREAWCLLADSGERAGASPEEIQGADRRCRP